MVALCHNLLASPGRIEDPVSRSPECSLQVRTSTLNGTCNGNMTVLGRVATEDFCHLMSGPVADAEVRPEGQAT